MFILMTFTLVQGHTGLAKENIQQVYCEDSPTKGLYDLSHSNDLDLQSRSQLRFKLDKCLTCSLISLTIFNLWHDGRLMHIMLMLILMTLTLMQGHSGLAEGKDQCCIMSITTRDAPTVSRYSLVISKALSFSSYALCHAVKLSHAIMRFDPVYVRASTSTRWDPSPVLHHCGSKFVVCRYIYRRNRVWDRP